MIYDFIVIGAGASGLFFAASRGLGLDLATPAARGKAARAGHAEKRPPVQAPSAGSPLLGGKQAGQPAAVLLLEHQERPGRKLLLSGGGKCNLTNLAVAPENYLCAEKNFCRHALNSFPPAHMLEFARCHGIELEEREHGQIFCRRGAEELRDLLLGLSEANAARLLTGQRIELVRALHRNWEFRPGGVAANGAFGPDARERGADAVVREAADVSGGGEPAPGRHAGEAEGAGARFAVQSNGKTYFARNLLAASGNKAWPRCGSSVFGLQLARSCGHSLIPLRPGLAPLKMPPCWPLHGLQGLSVTAKVAVISAVTGGKSSPDFTLPLLFTHQGLSGPACLQASSYLTHGDMLEIDFAPGINIEKLLDEPSGGKASIQSILRKHLPERLIDALLCAAGLEGVKSRRIAELSRTVRKQAGDAVNRYRVKPEQPGFGQAESTVGGVNTAEINPKSMESKLCPGLYFTGEVLDVCGQLGGYNLHWAWASAWLAGRG